MPMNNFLSIVSLKSTGCHQAAAIGRLLIDAASYAVGFSSDSAAGAAASVLAGSLASPVGAAVEDGSAACGSVSDEVHKV